MGRERVEVLDFLDHQDLLVTGGRLEISPRSLDLLDPQDPRELLETLAFLAKMETRERGEQRVSRVLRVFPESLAWMV